MKKPVCAHCNEAFAKHTIVRVSGSIEWECPPATNHDAA